LFSYFLLDVGPIPYMYCIYNYGIWLFWSKQNVDYSLFLGRIAVLKYVDPAYCYRLSSVVCLSICHSREPCKTAEPIEMPFGLWTRVGPGNHVLHGGTHWCNLANTIEPYMCSGDAAFLSHCFDHLLYELLWALYRKLIYRRGTRRRAMSVEISCCTTAWTRRPASADRTARRQFQATGQPVSRTQASDAMTSRLPRYDAKCVQRRCFQCGSVPLRSYIKGTELPLANILIPLERQLIALQLCCWQFLYNETFQQTSRPLLSKLYDDKFRYLIPISRKVGAA